MTEEQEKDAEKDWQERKQVWDDIFSHTRIPAEAGTTYKFGDIGNLWEVFGEMMFRWAENQRTKALQKP